MINLDYMIAEGCCDTMDEFRDYLNNLILLPARLTEWSVTPNEYMGRIQFRVKYQPLVKLKEKSSGKE